MPTVKVVILNWNGRDHLLEFLPSVIASTPQEYDIVVADNGSTDDSLDVLREQFPDVGIVTLDKNYGFAQGYNKALSLLESDYFILLNSDVQTTEGWCVPLIDALAVDKSLAAISPKILSYGDKRFFEYAGASGGFIDVLGYPFCRGRILSTIEMDSGQYDTPRDVFWASGACMAVRRELFTELGGFDNDFFAHMEEIDLCWRAQLLGYRVAVDPGCAVYHLGGGTLPNNSPFKIYLNYRNSLGMLYKNLSKRNFIIILPFRILMDIASSFVYLLQGRADFFREVFKAHRDFFKWRKTLREKREWVQSRKIASPKGVYYGSIVFRYFFAHKRFGSLM